MKILVTGGAGFIGSHVVDAYRAAGHTVAVLDDLSGGKKEHVPEGVPLFPVSITNRPAVERVFADFQPDVLNHHAAQVSVVYSVGSPTEDAERNILGTITLLQAAMAAPTVQKVIYASSGGAMYGNPQVLPCTEDAAAEPLSPYGLSKWTAERYVWLYDALAKQKDRSPYASTVLRYGNVYGPRQDPHGEAGVCAIFTDRMLAGEPVTIFGDGTHVRDYIFVEDVALANVAALDKGAGEAYNIATGQGTTTGEVFETLRTAIGYDLEPERRPARPGEVQEIVLSPEKAARELGWQAACAFPEGIARTVQHYRG
jgi:UDP-glucose 4-epimerase